VPADTVSWFSQLFWQGAQKAYFDPYNWQRDKIHPVIKPTNLFKTLRYIYIFIMFSIPLHPTYRRSILIVSSHLRLSSGFPTKTLSNSWINRATYQFVISGIYCFSTAAVVTRTRFNITLYVQRLRLSPLCSTQTIWGAHLYFYLTRTGVIIFPVPSYLGVVYLFNMLYFKISCVYCFHLMCICFAMCVCIAVLFTLDAGLLRKSQYSEGPATGHLDTGFSSVSLCL